MRITYDPRVDALYIRFNEGTFRTAHWDENIAADFDVEGQLVGIEILDAALLFSDLDVLKQVEFKRYGDDDKADDARDSH